MADYSSAVDVRELANALQAKFAFLAEIDMSRIMFLRSSGGRKKDVDVKGVRAPYSFISNYKFILTVYQNIYDDTYNDNQRKIALLKGLLKIDDFEEGTTRDFEIKGFIEIEGTYGVQWNYDDQDVPDILAETPSIQNEDQDENQNINNSNKEIVET